MVVPACDRACFGCRRRDGHVAERPVADRDDACSDTRLPPDLLRPAARSCGAVRPDLCLDRGCPVGLRVVYGDRVGGTDPGSAQSDDPMDHARHGVAGLVAFQRRPDHADAVMSSAATGRGAREASPGRLGPPGPTARLRAEGTTILRPHWPATVLLAAGLILRVLAQLAYRPAIFYIDTPRYLLNQAPGMDPLGYKAVLRAITAVANLDAVIVVQHALGLAMALVIYVLLLRRGTGRWLAALAI